MRALALIPLALPVLAGGCGLAEDYNTAIAHVQLAQVAENADDLVNPVDGTYKGTVTLAPGGSALCPGSNFGTLTVGDRTLTVAYTPSAIIAVGIQPDGSFRGEAGRVRLEGHVADGRLQFAVDSPVCHSDYDFRYVT